MIRWYLKFRIRRAVDRQLELPGWIQRKLDGDQELTRYAKEYARMMRQLSSGADAWIQDQTREDAPVWSEKVSALVQTLGANAHNAAHQPASSPPVTTHLRFANSACLQWAVCLVVTVFLTIGYLITRDRSNRDLARQESAQKAEIAVTVTRAVWDQGHRVADQCLVAWDRSLDSVSRNLLDRIGASAVAPLEGGSRWLGNAIRELHDGAVREQENLMDLSRQFRGWFEGLKSQ